MYQLESEECINLSTKVLDIRFRFNIEGLFITRSTVRFIPLVLLISAHNKSLSIEPDQSKTCLLFKLKLQTKYLYFSVF